MGHHMAASTMPLRNQNVFFLMGLYWPSNGTLPSRYRLPVLGRLIPSVQIVTGPVQNNVMRLYWATTGPVPNCLLAYHDLA